MSSVQEYLEKMSTEELQGILRSDCIGAIDLSIDDTLMICQILAQRDPNRPDPKAAWKRFLKYYLNAEK